MMKLGIRLKLKFKKDKKNFSAHPGLRFFQPSTDGVSEIPAMSDIPVNDSSEISVPSTPPVKLVLILNYTKLILGVVNTHLPHVTQSKLVRDTKPKTTTDDSMVH